MTDSRTNLEYLKQLTVLYVEDEAEARQQFALFLSRLVGTLIVAENGAEGLAAFLEHRPRIVITDIQMPIMDGLAMAAEIRSHDRLAQLVVLTAFEQVDYLKNSINTGVNKYLVKPINGFQLQETLLECAHTVRADEQLESAARTDLLTGLANRRELEIRFEAERGRALRYSTPFSVIIADIDHFKRINDTYSHLAGDRVLKMVADTFVSCTRAEDCCSRWGGEEFLLLLTDADLTAAAVVAEKLRSAVAAMTTVWEGEPLQVTVSLGVSSFRPGMDMDACIKLADEAMYRAKESGRNRVVLAEDR